VSRIITSKLDNWADAMKWDKTSKAIYFTYEKEGYEPVYKINIANEKVETVVADKAVGEFDLDSKENIYYTYSATGKPSALYRQPLNKNKVTQLTFLNKDIEDSVDIRPTETMWVEGSNGRKIQVFIVKPHDFDPSKKYPLIMNVHGGPQMQWMNSFRPDWQVYPAAGYVLAYPNPHGSTGYGQDFTLGISKDWGGKPFYDLMKVTDALSQLSYVDSTRMGAMGWSYGGYMMNWFQAKTKRFKCLASTMGLFDLRSMWGATEELWFPNFELNGQPWNSELYKKFSPSEYVKNFSTPTLIITGQLDFRVSYTQSLQYFNTLQTLGIPSRLIILKNDGHWPSNIKSMPLYYAAHLDWFHRYLGGAPSPYDVDKLVKNQVEY
jgi:dipeptidyl aminopeptidase/acylaminoacyl peptidase